jgi:uncharacterized protein YuzE
MKVRYHARTDTLVSFLKTIPPCMKATRTSRGVILDYDRDDNLISFEILDASKRVTDTRKLDLQLAE